MSSSSSKSSEETEITLYNPASEEAEELDPALLDQNVLDIEIDRELAERLLEVSKHLGLNPTIVASRAIDLVCEEVGTLDEERQQDEAQAGTEPLLQRYQARVDLLQVLRSEAEEPLDTGESEAEQSESTASPSQPASEKGNQEDRKLWEVTDEAEEEPDDQGTSPWSTVEQLMNAFSDSSEQTVEDDESWPQDQSAVDEAAIRDGTLEEAESGENVESEDDIEKADEWNAVDSIIEAGREARG